MRSGDRGVLTGEERVHVFGTAAFRPVTGHVVETAFGTAMGTLVRRFLLSETMAARVTHPV